MTTFCLHIDVTVTIEVDASSQEAAWDAFDRLAEKPNWHVGTPVGHRKTHGDPRLFMLHEVVEPRDKSQ